MRTPSHPGKILLEHYIKPLKININELSNISNIPQEKLVSIINEEESIDDDISLKLSRVFNTSKYLWINLQNRYNNFKNKNESTR